MPESLQNSVDVVAAALSYNELSVSEGYDAFDADEDGQISLEALKSAVKQLSLNLTPEATFELFQYMQGGVTGSVTREEWLRVISIGRGEAVLQSLGVTAGDIGEASSGTSRRRPAQENRANRRQTRSRIGCVTLSTLLRRL
jgi:hypothetical protein